MERFTISVSDSLAAEFDQWLEAKGYTNRSEGFRDLLRQTITKEHIQKNQAKYSIATLSFVYNHHERMLADRLTTLQHQAHDLVICSSHVHLDHDNCLECLYLRGQTALIQQFANSLAAESGVRHSVLNLIPVEIHNHEHSHSHSHADEHDHHPHVHVHPLS